MPNGQIKRKSEVSALVSIIANSAMIIESYYEDSSKPYVPSLDDLEAHPLDNELSSLELQGATQSLEGACAQLCALLTRPNHNLTNKFMSIYLSACLNTVLQTKVVDIIGTKQGGMPIEEISEKTGIDAAKLGRVMRLLCSNHIFTEVTTDVFANNRLSIQLQASNPLADLGLHFADEDYKATGYLYETLSDPVWGKSSAPNHAPFNKQTGYTRPLFVYFEGDDNEKGAEQGARFGRGMMGFNVTTEALSIVKEFPWHELREGATVNDIGGGVGHMMIELARVHPNLKFKVQDLPERIEQAKNEVWPQECPEAIEKNRVEFKPYNFLQDRPIANCDVYYLKHIIHNWSNEDSVNILTNVRKAMGPKSRVLIHEHILQTANRVPDDQCRFTQAPEPLLANFGAGRIRQYNLDLALLNMLNSQARRLDDFVKLAEMSGLEFYKLWEFGEMSAVELRCK